MYIYFLLLKKEIFFLYPYLSIYLYLCLIIYIYLYLCLYINTEKN